MPDSLVDYSPVLEETADVPEVLVALRRPMCESVRPPLQAYPMNDCKAECASAPLSASQGWVAFNKHKLQEIFEATFTEMTAEASQPVEESSTACSPEAESQGHADEGDDEKENAVGQQSSSPCSVAPSPPPTPSSPSSSSSTANPPDDHSNPAQKRKRAPSSASITSSPGGHNDPCSSDGPAESTSSGAAEESPPKPCHGGRRRSMPVKDAKGAKGNGPAAGKGVSEHWVALNKTVVLDMFESAMQHSASAEVLDLSTRPRSDQQGGAEEEAGGGEEEEEEVTLASPVKQKSARKRKGGSSGAVINKGKRRKEAANKAEKPARKTSCRESRVQRPKKGSSGSTQPSIDAVQNAVDDPSVSPASRRAPPSAMRVRRGHSSSPQSHERIPHASSTEQCSPDAKGHEEESADIDRKPRSAALSVLAGDERVAECASAVPMGRSDSKESPKHGWVALSKADVHTIVDSVVSSIIIGGGGGGGENSEPAPPSLQDQPPAPSLPQPTTPRSNTRRVSFASVDQLAKGSPPDSPVASSDEGGHLHRPFKWKSNMMMRANAGDGSMSPNSSD